MVDGRGRPSHATEGNMEIIDLTRPITDSQPGWPGDVPVRLWRHQTLADGSPNVSGITLGSHAGTHLDAPRHWFEDGETVDQVALWRLMGEARVLDLCNRSEPAVISLAELRARVGEAWGRATGCLATRASAASEAAEDERLLLLTGWRGQPADGDWPALSPEAIEWVVARRPALIGVDTPSVDPPSAGYAHEALLGAGIAVVELLVSLERLVGKRFRLNALPLPVVGLDGAPVRAVALLEG